MISASLKSYHEEKDRPVIYREQCERVTWIHRFFFFCLFIASSGLYEQDRLQSTHDVAPLHGEWFDSSTKSSSRLFQGITQQLSIVPKEGT